MPAHNKETYYRLKSLGLCPECGKNRPTGGKALCDECYGKKNAETKMRKMQARSLGICPRCKKNRIYVGENACPDCMEKARQYHRDHSKEIAARKKKCTAKKKQWCIENGICIYCHTRPVTPGLKSCAFCRPKYRKKREHEIPAIERPSYGMCYYCGEPVIPGKKVCQKHYDIAMANRDKAMAAYDSAKHKWRQDEQARHEKIRSKYQR